jgi:Helicase conserved C-terminal domain/SNF2-related domain
MPLHALQRRFLAEDLVRRRAPEEGRRYAASQRSGRIDPNPHQLDAVVFALRRIPEGGCILADEVGLGKTIEAGLIISQLLAEGSRRVLLVVPKALLGQWKAELFDLFGVDAREVRVDPEAVRGEGVFIVHREFAGGKKGGPLLWGADPFDLVVIDEAHETFAGIYKRYNKKDVYDEDSSKAQTAGRLRELIRRHRAPVLLLTATPIQNTLTELWGLVQYVEPTGSLLGSLSTFRELFCSGGDRDIAHDQAFELKRRLGHVLQRTLRRQAQEFLEVPFVERRTRLLTFEMSPEERALHDEVSEWLLDPELLTFSGNNGRLLLIGFLRRMASSLPALAASLRRVALRIEGHLLGGKVAPVETMETLIREFEDDLEEEDRIVPSAEPEPEPEPEAEREEPQARKRLREELAQVERFIERAESLPREGKAQSLIEAVREIRAPGRAGACSGKIIIFTESLTTQDYILKILLETGVPAREVTLFRGQNSGARAREALEVWLEEVGSKLPKDMRPSRENAMRLALVHEFKEHSSVFVSTEAGAKGLNLQFCETLINFDLPWNPQRIEQRIGRVHRYGQKRPVTIINFLARDNEAQRLLFEILSQKLELFGTVLDSSDAVLHEAKGPSAESLVSAVGADLERSLADIYDTSRSMAEVTDRLRDLSAALEEERRAFAEEQSRTAEVIEDRLDENVRKIFKHYQSQLSNDLAEFDKDLDRILCAYLEAKGVDFARAEEPDRVSYAIQPSPALPRGYQEGAHVCTGRALDPREGSVLHLGHPLIRAAVGEAREATRAPGLLGFKPSSGAWPDLVRPLVGKRGRAVLSKIRYFGLEGVDHLVWVAVLEGSDEPLSDDVIEQLLAQVPYSIAEGPSGSFADAELFADLVEERIMLDEAAVAETEQKRFDKAMRQLDRYLQDQVMVLRRQRHNLDAQADKLEHRQEKETGTLARGRLDVEAATLKSQVERLDARIEALSAGDDADYRRWVDALQQRRYKAPEVEPLVEFDFVVGEATEERC